MLLREIIQSLLVNLIQYNGEKISHLNDNEFHITAKENKKMLSMCYTKQKKEVVRKLLLSILRINFKIQSLPYSSKLQQETDVYNILISAREELGKLKNNMKGKCDLIIDKHIGELNAVFLSKVKSGLIYCREVS